MHCDTCNIDFPEGLHYCKWCGEALVDHPRITSELHTCPSCAVTVQPAWTFCKACGQRLHGAVREPAANACPVCGANVEPGARNCPRCSEDLTAERASQIPQGSADTMVIAKCPSCSEYVDTGSLYCKACGSAVYTEQTPFGDSALLCGACNSYSPFGSRECRICGAPLAQAAQTVVDRPVFVPQEPGGEREPPPERHSDQHTMVFSGAERDEQVVTSRTRPSAQTNVLSGTAGSSEQQAKTSVVQMGRITGPVEEDETPHEESSSGEINKTAASEKEQPAALKPTLVFPAVQAALPESTTAGFGSEPVSKPASAEGGTEVFASPLAKSPPAQAEQVSQDQVRTREFVPPPPPDEGTPTRIQPAWPGAVQNIGEGQQVSAQPAEAGITRDISSAGVTTLPVEQASSQPLPKKRTGVLIASAAVAIVVIVAAVAVGYWLLFGHGRAARPQAPQVVVEQPRTTPERPAPPPQPTAPVAPEGMLAVGAGSYTIGRDGAEPLEQPQHKIDLPAFFIDRTEVTNAAYKKFVDATGHKPPSNWSGANFPDRRDNSPVTGVTWQDAADYAAWAGKRLPSEGEWEAAARGTDGLIYPWGNDWHSGLANIGLTPDKPTAEQYPLGLGEVGRYPQSASPVGAMDMIGNAWEWVADEFALYPGGITTVPKEIKDKMKPGLSYRVIRGGAYDGDEHHDATYRGLQDAGKPYPKVGFRCVKDAK